MSAHANTNTNARSHLRTLAGTAGPPDAAARRAEAIAGEAYDAVHHDDSFAALKRRARFSKEDAGLFRDWMAAAERGALTAPAAGGR